MSQNFDNLDWVDGQHSVPGIFPEIYYIPKSKILVWPVLPLAPASAVEEVTYDGNFTLAVGAIWKSINCIDVKSVPTSEPQGEIRCVSVNNKLTIVVSLTEEKASAFCKLANNTDLVYLFRERDSKKYRLVGSEMFTTLTKASLNIGSEPTGEKGVTIEIESTDIVPFPFYPGAIANGSGAVVPDTGE